MSFSARQFIYLEIKTYSEYQNCPIAIIPKHEARLTKVNRSDQPYGQSDRPDSGQRPRSTFQNFYFNIPVIPVSHKMDENVRNQV